MSTQETFLEFDRHESREKLDELHTLIERAWKLAREVRDGGALCVDSYGRLADVCAALARAELESAKAWQVEDADRSVA
jgi:hypothetical protein